MTTIPRRFTRTELLRPLFTVPGAKFSIRSPWHAFITCPGMLVNEAAACIRTAARIKGFGITLGQWDGGGFLVVTDRRENE